MKRALVKFRNNIFGRQILKYKKYAPLLFFIGGFTFDSLTLGRIDQLYDLIVLCLYMTLLPITLYLYNLADDNKWENTFLEAYEDYFPLAIQFFFGGLSSAFVIYFSRSVSLSKTISFFVILIAFLFANEFLQKRISNKYLQFSLYFFVSFTFFTFIVPVFAKEMNTEMFLWSGLIGLITTLLLIIFIYLSSPSTRVEIRLGKVVGIILTIYAALNLFYYFSLIPPVPLALQTGIVAHDVHVENKKYLVTYEKEDVTLFWRKHRLKFIHVPGEKVYIFTSIFAPTSIEKMIFHRWNWYNEATRQWEIVEDIGYDIRGGRNDGYRGYTFKTNVKKGLWKVEVITEEELVIGVVDFEIITSDSLKGQKLAIEKF